MLIDWFTVVAQIINFLLLVFLLWRFLYKPILRTMDRRQEELEDRWNQADEQRQVADQEADHYRNQQGQLEQKRQDILAQVHEEAEQQRQEKLQQARQELEAMQRDWRKSVQQQQQSFLENLKQQVAQQVYQITRQALRELVDADLEEQAIATFLDRVRHLDDEERRAIAQSLPPSNQSVQIRSGFEIPEDLRQAVIETLQQQELLDSQRVEFNVAPELICGVELRFSGQAIAWNLADHLRSLEEKTAATLRQTTQSRRGDRAPTEEPENEAAQKPNESSHE